MSARDRRRRVGVFELVGPGGMRARLLDWGATLASLEVPDRSGRLGPVVLGFDDPERYRGPHPHLGGTIGRCANRIANARFTLAGRVYRLAANLGRHHLHGGITGFDAVFWDAEPLHARDGSGVRFRHHSPDGDEGYPGALDVEVDYTLTDAGELRIDYRAVSDALTLVNLTHHSYFNLRDGGAGDVLGHRLRIDADAYTPVDAEAIPTGSIAAVEGTPFDFRSERPIGERIHETSGGYDHNFVLCGSDRRPAAVLADPDSGRRMEVYTSQPGLQLYTSNFLDGTLVGRGATAYRRHAAVCLETQHFPDSPHHSGFPPIELAAGERYVQTTVYRFESNGFRR